MIEASQLSRKYGDTFAVEALSFHVGQGEVMGLLGPNGAGKSTTMKMLTCYLPPSSGKATVAGYTLEQPLEVRRRIGYLPEHAPSYSELDVEGHLAFVGRMHGMPPATLADRIREMADVCGLNSVLHRRIDELSKGYRQRVGLAASMLHDPPCLILDEPTTGLDPNQIVEIRQLIRRLGEAKAVLLSSHQLAEVEAACDRMMIIDRGKLQAIGTARELAGQAHSGTTLHVTYSANGDAAVAALRRTIPGVEVQADGEGRYMLMHHEPGLLLAETVFLTAVETGAVIVEMRPEAATLEDVFRRITGGGA